MTLLVLAIALCHGGDSKKLWKKPSSLRSGTSSSSDDGTSCPDGSSTDEGEECRTSNPDTFNGGCGGFPGSSGFTNIAFGESVCGTVSKYVYNGEFGIVSDIDTDWYDFKVSEDTTVSVSVRLTTDFDASLYLGRLGDGASCPFSGVAEGTDVGNNNYVISSSVTAGDYSIVVSPVFDPSLSCPTPGNYTLTLTDEPIP